VRGGAAAKLEWPGQIGWQDKSIYFANENALAGERQAGRRTGTSSVGFRRKIGRIKGDH